MTDKEVHQLHRTEPRFFYGYIVVAAVFFIMVASWGFYNAFGVFFKPLLTEFGWTRALTSGAFSLSVIMYGALGIVMGGLTDRFGPRIVIALCGFLLGIGYLLMAILSAPWQLYLFYGVMIGTGVGGAFVPPLSTVARWFVKRRSLVSGIVLSGVGIGGIIGPLVISRLIAAYGWRLSYIILGCIVLVVMIIAASFLRRDPTQIGQLPYGESEGKQEELKAVNEGFSFKEAVHTVQFWLVFFMFFCFGFNMFAVTIHIVPHVIELGHSAITAANILSVSLGVSILGNFALGSAGDRIGNRKIFIIGFALMLATLLWLTQAGEVWMLYLFAFFFAFSHGGLATSESPLIASLFGLRAHGLIFGVAILGFTIGGAIGPLLTGYIFDVTNSYQGAFLVCAAVSAIGIILTAILRPTKRLDIGA